MVRFCPDIGQNISNTFNTLVGHIANILRCCNIACSRLIGRFRRVGSNSLILRGHQRLTHKIGAGDLPLHISEAQGSAVLDGCRGDIGHIVAVKLSDGFGFRHRVAFRSIAGGYGIETGVIQCEGKVVIENKDFEKLIRQYDRPVSFFYLDPPYHATEGYYQNIGEDGFTEADHIRLRDALMRIQGKFLLSYNDDAFIRGLYDQPSIYLMETTRINNIKQRYDNGAQFPELLIANYDLQERSRVVPSQMTLFDWTGGEAIG